MAAHSMMWHTGGNVPFEQTCAKAVSRWFVVNKYPLAARNREWSILKHYIFGM
jgi:hypothetical protein